MKPIIGIEAYVTPGTHRCDKVARPMGFTRAEER